MEKKLEQLTLVYPRKNVLIVYHNQIESMHEEDPKMCALVARTMAG